MALETKCWPLAPAIISVEIKRHKARTFVFEASVSMEMVNYHHLISFSMILVTTIKLKLPTGMYYND